MELSSSVRSLPTRPSSSSIDAALPERERNAFGLVLRAARHALRRRVRVVRIAGRAYAKLSRHETALAQVRADLLALARLAKAWAQRDYRAVPWRTLLYGVAALLYFLNPFDAVPDVLLVLGLADDVAVVTIVVRALRVDLDTFLSWENGLRPGPAREADVVRTSPPDAPGIALH